MSQRVQSYCLNLYVMDGTTTVPIVNSSTASNLFDWISVGFQLIVSFFFQVFPWLSMPLEVPPWIGTIKVLITYSRMNLICRGESGKRKSFE